MAWTPRPSCSSHNKVRLALHQLRNGDGRRPAAAARPGRATPHDVPAEVADWPGPVWGLDFTGHGESTIPKGGGYTCELLMADVDVALHHLGEATLYGRGLGGYVGLLVAGARPDGGAGPGDRRRAGPGRRRHPAFDGGHHHRRPRRRRPAPPDPFALQELSRDVRPADYAASFAREAVKQSGLETPLLVSAFARPPWLAAVADEYGVEAVPVSAALARFAPPAAG